MELEKQMHSWKAVGTRAQAIGRQEFTQGTQKTGVRRPSRDAGKQCGGPRTRQDSQKGVQETWEYVNRAPSTRYSTLWSDTLDDSGSMFCGIWTSKTASGHAGKQCGGPGTRQDSQEGVQEAREGTNIAPQTAL